MPRRGQKVDGSLQACGRKPHAQKKPAGQLGVLALKTSSLMRPKYASEKKRLPVVLKLSPIGKMPALSGFPPSPWRLPEPSPATVEMTPEDALMKRMLPSAKPATKMLP